MKKYLLIPIFILSAIFFNACEKEIDLDMPAYEPKIVVEGIIENGEFPWVSVTKNQGYLEEFQIPNIDSTTGMEQMMAFIQKYIVTDATVIVSDGIMQDTLTFGINPEILATGAYVYPPAKYVGTKLKGEVGRTYSLRILHDGKEYTASTTIPKPFQEDSLWYKPDDHEVGFGYISALISDDPNELNYYTYFCKREGKDKYFTRGARMVSLWDDKMFNGMTGFEIPVLRGANGGYDKTKEENEEKGRFFKEGDSVTIKVCTMDNNSYLFWKTATSSGGSMMGQPGAVKTNIVGGGLGIWCGYGVRYVGARCIVK